VPDVGNQLLLRTMLDAGLRCEEAAGLHGFRLDLLRRRLRVHEVLERDGGVKAEPKSEAGERWVPLTEDLVAGYAAHMEGRSREGLVFTDGRGGPVRYDNWLKRVWRPAVAPAGLEAPLPTPHDCRHTYGSWLADQGVCRCTRSRR
jgi:integrase